MNKTLIQILTENIQHKIPEKYATLDDLTTWNKENRNERLAEVRELTSFLADEAVEYLKYISTEKVKGKTILELRIQQEIEISIAQFMSMCREQMDATDLKKLGSEFPFDYEWIQPVIRDSLNNITNLEDTCLQAEGNRLKEYLKSEEL
jgi:hypothetical protein